MSEEELPEPNTLSVAETIGALTCHPDFEEWYAEFMLFKKFVGHWRQRAQHYRLECERLQEVNNQLIMKLGMQGVEFEAASSHMRERYEALREKFRMQGMILRDMDAVLTLQQRTALGLHSSE